jgi:hypothetical protein
MPYSIVEQEANQERGGLNGCRLMTDLLRINGSNGLMINRLTGVFMASVTMPQVLKMASVEMTINLQVLKMASVTPKINDLAKVPSALYTPHLHNHYLSFLINQSLQE